MEQKRKFPITAFQIFRDAVPRVLAQLQRVEADASRALVWLVGLASTLLALALSNPTHVKDLLGADYKRATGSLLAVVVLGVTCRILALWVGAQRVSLMLRLENYLAGYRAAHDSHIPSELSDTWSETEIVRHLRDDFDVDYEFLLRYNTPIEGCRKAYQEQYALSQRFDEAQMQTLKTVLVAHAGLSRAEGEALFAPVSEAALKKIHRKAIAVRILDVCNAILFAAAGASFVTAMVYVARALWRT